MDAARYAHLADGATHARDQAAAEGRMNASFDAADFLAGASSLEGSQHLKLDDTDNVALLRWVVRRGSDCMCLPETPRTTVK